MRNKIFNYITIAIAIMSLAACSSKDDKAVEQDTGSIYGVVSDKATGYPVSSAEVALSPSGEQTVTDARGLYEFVDLEAGNYRLHVSKAGYADLVNYSIKVEAGEDTEGNLQIEKLPPSLRITNSSGDDIDSLNFGSDPDVTTANFNVFNDGAGVLTWDIVESSEWITSVSKRSGTLQPGKKQGITVTIDRDLLESGENVTTLNVNSDDGSKEITVLAEGIFDFSSCGGDFTDSRDGQVYPTVQIGTQCWMSKNMNIGTRVAGSNYNTHQTSGIQKMCYDNSESNCDIYGGLYSWNETVNGENSYDIKYVSGSSTMIQGICPDGWHVPSDEEFKTLEKYLGMSSSEADDYTAWRGTDEGRKLKSRDYWYEYDASTSGTNSSGWSGRPGGIRNNSGGTFHYVGAYGYWWSSSEYSSSSAWYRDLSYNEARVDRTTYNKSSGFSVRCLLN
jgi:uncharacterized protein (TIGR02145 family)